MTHQHAHDFRHTSTLNLRQEVIGVVLTDEDPNHTGIYFRMADGGLYPVRTVRRKSDRSPVIDAWLARAGTHEDLRLETQTR